MIQGNSVSLDKAVPKTNIVYWFVTFRIYIQITEKLSQNGILFT